MRLIFSLALLGALAGTADAKQVKFTGVHPIAVSVGGGFCYIEAPHVHVYTPDKVDVLYRDHDGHHHFVGDPVPYGYDGPKHAYYGAHPVAVDVVLDEDELDGDEVEYCYLEGPHYHYFTPPPEVKFKTKGGVYWYVGDFPPEYERGKPRYAKVNVVYKPLKYARPVVVVAPPVEYHGHVVEVHDHHPHGHGHAGVEVVAPSVEVVVPAPRLELRVGGIIEVDGHHHHHKHKKHKHKKHKGRW
jgi:hypothetical protein